MNSQGNSQYKELEEPPNDQLFYKGDRSAFGLNLNRDAQKKKYELDRQKQLQKRKQVQEKTVIKPVTYTNEADYSLLLNHPENEFIDDTDKNQNDANMMLLNVVTNEFDNQLIYFKEEDINNNNQLQYYNHDPNINNNQLQNHYIQQQQLQSSSFSKKRQMQENPVSERFSLQPQKKSAAKTTQQSEYLNNSYASNTTQQPITMNNNVNNSVNLGRKNFYASKFIDVKSINNNNNVKLNKIVANILEVNSFQAPLLTLELFVVQTEENHNNNNNYTYSFQAQQQKLQKDTKVKGIFMNQLSHNQNWLNQYNQQKKGEAPKRFSFQYQYCRELNESLVIFIDQIS